MSLFFFNNLKLKYKKGYGCRSQSYLATVELKFYIKTCSNYADPSTTFNQQNYNELSGLNYAWQWTSYKNCQQGEKKRQ